MPDAPLLPCHVHPVRVRQVRRKQDLYVQVQASDAPLVARQPAGEGRWTGCEWAAMLLPGTRVPEWLRDYLALTDGRELASGRAARVLAVPVTEECSFHVVSWAIPSANPVLPAIVSLGPISEAHWSEVGSGKVLPSPTGVEVGALLGLHREAAPVALKATATSNEVANLLRQYEALTAAEAAAFRNALGFRA